jgi:hypothetical protein
MVFARFAKKVSKRPEKTVRRLSVYRFTQRNRSRTPFEKDQSAKFSWNFTKDSPNEQIIKSHLSKKSTEKTNQKRFIHYFISRTTQLEMRHAAYFSDERTSVHKECLKNVNNFHEVMGWGRTDVRSIATRDHHTFSGSRIHFTLWPDIVLSVQKSIFFFTR